MKRWCFSRISLLVVLGLVGAGCSDREKGGGPAESLDTVEGWGSVEAFYLTGCASCHGSNGEGSNPKVVPAIAGLPDYYVVGELIKFQDFMRGAEPDAPDGVIKMHGISTGMDLELMQGMAAYIAGMPAVASEVTTSEGADLERGKKIYEAQCAECHGSNAEGDVVKRSPPLYVFQDWYVARQIEKFQTKMRKSDPANEASMLMHAKANTMVLEEDVKDVTGYIVSKLEGVGDAEP